MVLLSDEQIIKCCLAVDYRVIVIVLRSTYTSSSLNFYNVTQEHKTDI